MDIGLGFRPVMEKLVHKLAFFLLEYVELIYIVACYIVRMRAPRKNLIEILRFIYIPYDSFFVMVCPC